MEILGWDKGEEWGDSAFLEVVPFTAYLLSSERTAWWNTLVRTYNGPRDLYTTFKSAAKSAQSKRLQGTSFTIEEIPSLAFISSEGMIIASEFGHLNPFSEVDLDYLSSFLIIGTQMLLLQGLTRTSSGALWRNEKRSDSTYIQAFAPIDTSLKLIANESTFQSWRSYPRWRDQLDWDLEENGRSVDGIRAVQEAYERQNHEVTRLAAHKYFDGLYGEQIDREISLETQWHEGFNAAKIFYKVDENPTETE